MKNSVAALLSRFDDANARLTGATERVLSQIVGDRFQHARFMNTLSMMEHLGSQKIMATQHGPKIDQPTLKHLAEEARHAFFFKRVAEREAGREMTAAAADLLAPLAGRHYMQRLEAQIVRLLPVGADRRTAYLMMSVVIEFRAVWGYRLYQTVLTRAGHGLSLKSLLAEESGHLDDMAARLLEIGQLDLLETPALWQLEQSLYERLLSGLTRDMPALAA